MIKILFFDIDGTLVSFRTHEIPASTIDALARARANGLKIFISTGRPPQIMNNITAIQERGLVDGYITMNGAYCYIGDEVVFKSPIPDYDVQALIGVCRQQGFPCIFVSEKDIAVCAPNHIVREVFYEGLGVPPLRQISWEEAVQGTYYQLTPFFPVEAQPMVMAAMPSCEFGRWHPTFVDITCKGNTKQEGIGRMLHTLHLDVSETMAFGDGGNDMGMLRYVAVGVAMGNANEEVKQCADYVTASVDDDGIQQALQHFQLI